MGARRRTTPRSPKMGLNAHVQTLHQGGLKGLGPLHPCSAGVSRGGGVLPTSNRDSRRVDAIPIVNRAYRRSVAPYACRDMPHVLSLVVHARMLTTLPLTHSHPAHAHVHVCAQHAHMTIMVTWNIWPLRVSPTPGGRGAFNAGSTHGARRGRVGTRRHLRPVGSSSAAFHRQPRRLLLPPAASSLVARAQQRRRPPLEAVVVAVVEAQEVASHSGSAVAE